LAVYRRSNRHRYILVLLVLTSITLVTLDQRSNGSGVTEAIKSGARDALAPVASAVHDVTDPVAGFFSTVTHYAQLTAENARLRRRLEAARADQLKAADAQRVQRSLLQLDGLPFAGDVKSVAARVISNSPTSFQLAVVIDKGSDAGLLKGMPVVTAGGLVGRIQEASRRQATVLLVTDPSFNVGVRLTDSGDVGVATGAGARDPLTVDLIDLATKVSSNEVVVTSGLQQSVFPPGIPVGRVRSAHVRPGALQQDVRVDPVVDLRRLEFVRVLLWHPTDAVPARPGP
jgi:rod shape-determining protein MreC